jgi:hypothetical protein
MTGGAAVENTSLMMYRCWGREIGRAAYFDVNGISCRTLTDKYYSESQAGDIDLE